MAAMADPWDQLSVMSSSCQKLSESLMLASRCARSTFACTSAQAMPMYTACIVHPPITPRPIVRFIVYHGSRSGSTGQRTPPAYARRYSHTALTAADVPNPAAIAFTSPQPARSTSSSRKTYVPAIAPTSGPVRPPWRSAPRITL